MFHVNLQVLPYHQHKNAVLSISPNSLEKQEESISLNTKENNKANIHANKERIETSCFKDWLNGGNVYDIIPFNTFNVCIFNDVKTLPFLIITKAKKTTITIMTKMTVPTIPIILYAII